MINPSSKLNETGNKIQDRNLRAFKWDKCTDMRVILTILPGKSDITKVNFLKII